MVEPLDDSTWVARCIARMVELDPALDPELARPVVEDMCFRQRWREMGPETAAQAVFDLDMRRH
jgi:hypothetical protein